MTREEFAPLDAFLMARQGGYEEFEIDYTIENKGTWKDAGFLICVHPVSIGDQSMRVAISPGSTIKAGDIFTLYYGALDYFKKVYKITHDTQEGNNDVIEIDGSPGDRLLIDGTVSDGMLLNGASIVILRFQPPIQEEIPYSSVNIKVNNVKFNMAIKDVHSYKVGAPELYKLDLDLEEVF